MPRLVAISPPSITVPHVPPAHTETLSTTTDPSPITSTPDVVTLLAHWDLSPAQRLATGALTTLAVFTVLLTAGPGWALAVLIVPSLIEGFTLWHLRRRRSRRPPDRELRLTREGYTLGPPGHPGPLRPWGINGTIRVRKQGAARTSVYTGSFFNPVELSLPGDLRPQLASALKALFDPRPTSPTADGPLPYDPRDLRKPNIDIR